MSESPHLTEHSQPSTVSGAGQAVYDDSDLNARIIVRLGGGLFAFILVILLVVGGLFRYFDARENRRDQDALPMAREDAARPVEERVKSIPAPRLEGIEPASVAERRAADAGRLTHYGWVDEKGEVIHIPIDVAKKVILEKNLLPHKPEAPAKGQRSPSLAPQACFAQESGKGPAGEKR
jgi:hypothetical protein